MDLMRAVKKKTEEFFPRTSVEIYDEFIIVDQCVDFSIYKNYIHIDAIQKCKYTGTENLKKIEMIARSFPNFRYMELEDVSTIVIEDTLDNRFEYSLPTLYIMATGMSWYNSYEFYQETFDQDYIKYSNIIKKNFINTFNYIKDNLSTLETKDYDILFKHLIIFDRVLFNDRENIIINCINYILDNCYLLDISNTSSIKDVGKKIKESRNESNEIIYLKVMILSFMDISFKYQWKKHEKEVKNLIKYIN